MGWVHIEVQDNTQFMPEEFPNVKLGNKGNLRESLGNKSGNQPLLAKAT